LTGLTRPNAVAVGARVRPTTGLKLPPRQPGRMP
jgi:hypothetical protein